MTPRPIPAPVAPSACRGPRAALPCLSVTLGLLTLTLVPLVASPARAQDADPGPVGAVELDPAPPAGGFATPPPPTSLQLRPRRPWGSGPWRPTLGFDIAGELGAGRSLLGFDLGIGAVAYERFLVEARLS